MMDVLDKYYPNDAYSHSERVRIRSEISLVIGNSPIVEATFYRTTSQYDALATSSGNKNYYNGAEIYGIHTSGGHTYFSYEETWRFDYGR